MFILFRASEVKVAQSVHTVSSMRTYTHTYVYTKSTLFLHKIIEGGTWYTGSSVNLCMFGGISVHHHYCISDVQYQYRCGYINVPNQTL